MNQDIRESCFLCTCCGFRNPRGESCMCAEDKCSTCLKCVLHCKTPTLHSRLLKGSSTWEWGWEERATETNKPLMTAEDRIFLAELGVGW